MSWPIYYLRPKGAPQPPTEHAIRNTKALNRMLERGKTMLASELPGDAFAEAPRVWIVAGGPSLRGFDFEQLRGEVVIGVNRAYENPCVGMNFSMDTRFLKWALEGALGDASAAAWNAFQGFKVFSTLQDAIYPFGAGIHTIPRSNDRRQAIPNLRSFGHASNGGFGALQLAWALGAREIRLLGFDMHGENGKQAWNHDGYPIVQRDSVYRQFVRDFDLAAPAIKAAGIKVVNHSPHSALNCFPKATLGDAAALLRSKPTRPLVCCFATRGTAYEQEAAEMVRSAKAFGLETHVELVSNRGSWQANTYQKAEIIHELLTRFDRPILFVDADARFRRYPALFDDMTADLAISYFNWDAIPGRKNRTGRELSSAVMYLRPCKPVYRLLDSWIKLNNTRLASGHRAIEQRNLQEVFEGWSSRNKPVAMELPHTYNQIFDSMAECGDPVIEQMQASRRLKQAVAA